ncbi:hypothetical protein ACINK0_13225 [Deinococcus sp. VB343]|uniref:hypothetical protein n=1 Tax=Deinococcus sp. VB343 TaxID=3385567 RepID=UPI0039C8CB27
MNSVFLRSAVVTGLLIAAVNVLFAGLDYGFNRLPLWFYLVQLLILPAMLLPLRMFPQAAMTPDYLRRAALYALGWAVPYAIYKFSSDALNPAFTPAASLTGYLFTVMLFALLFAAIRKPPTRK